MRNRQERLLELLDRHGEELYTLLTRLTLREDVAEELMQELFIKLSSTDALDGIDNWYGYTRTTAVNLAFDHHRRNKRAAAAVSHVSRPEVEHGSPLGGMVQAEELQQVLRAIGRLNGTSREVFVMRYIQQRSYDYIAEQLGKTSHQVRGLCAKAMFRMRELVGSARPELHTEGAI